MNSGIDVDHPVCLEYGLHHTTWKSCWPRGILGSAFPTYSWKATAARSKVMPSASAMRSQSPFPSPVPPLMVPGATLALVAIHISLFLHPLRAPEGACLSLQTVWEQGQWCRLLLAPFHHLGPFHLLPNMLALGWLGRSLELEVGSLRTGVGLVALALLGGLFHLALNAALAAMTGDPGYRQHCAVGFSGVLFSLEAMGRRVEPIPVAPLGSGFAFTTRWLCLLECLALAILFPRSSLTGHFSGILAGLVFSMMPILYWGIA